MTTIEFHLFEGELSDLQQGILLLQLIQLANLDWGEFFPKNKVYIFQQIGGGNPFF